jgi:hypothetical protein
MEQQSLGRVRVLIDPQSRNGLFTVGLFRSCQLQRLRYEPGMDVFDNVCLAFQVQPVARRQVCHGKILARITHWLS